MKKILSNTFRTFFAFSLTLALLAGCIGKSVNTGNHVTIDEELRDVLARKAIQPIEKEEVNPHKTELGRMLFWDKILSGARNISCVTCHLPEAATSDALPLPIGEGGVGTMKNRYMPEDRKDNFIFVRRNSPDLFNRGKFVTMFWDGRVMMRENGEFRALFSSTLPKDHRIWTPQKRLLPKGLDNALAAQAMFPPTSDIEMKSVSHENTLGRLEDWDRLKIWDELIGRLRAIEEYRRLFAKAYPDVSPEELSFVHAANALAAFQVEAFTLTDAPFDNYLRGEDQALTTMEKRGALLFYGKARCASCHSGPLMTDQVFHNRVVPQLGPGKGYNPGGGPDGTWDGGRGGVTGWTGDWYRFRTPPLRNVEKTGPWMHDGAYSDLESAVRHQLNPIQAAKEYDPARHLPEIYISSYRGHQTERIASLADPAEIAPISLTDTEVDELIAFLKSLTSPQVDDLTRWTPSRVPSGLPVED
jgi:cytochrome c peroxidase